MKQQLTFENEEIKELKDFIAGVHRLVEHGNKLVDLLAEIAHSEDDTTVKDFILEHHVSVLNLESALGIKYEKYDFKSGQFVI